MISTVTWYTRSVPGSNCQDERGKHSKVQFRSESRHGFTSELGTASPRMHCHALTSTNSARQKSLWQPANAAVAFPVFCFKFFSAQSRSAGVGQPDQSTSWVRPPQDCAWAIFSIAGQKADCRGCIDALKVISAAFGGCGRDGENAVCRREAICGLWTLKYNIEDEQREATVWLEV